MSWKEIHAEFLKGNKYGQRFKTTEERQKVYYEFCEHIAKGYSIDSFPRCAEATMLKMIKEYPNELSPDMLETAKRYSKRLLENMGLSGTSGKIKGFVPRSWEFIMMNKFGMSRKQTIDQTNIEAKQEIKDKIRKKKLVKTKAKAKKK